MKTAGWEIASYGLKWVDYCDMLQDEECVVIVEVICLYIEVVGERLRGWYMG